MNGKMVIEIIIISLCIAFWCFYAIFEGIREAFYYDAAMRADTIYDNIHWIYSVQRGILLAIVGVCTLDIMLIIGLMCVFPFIHDGYYYVSRNELDVRLYPKRFWSSSTTSTARMEFSLLPRVILLIAGVASLTGSYLLIIYSKT